MQKRLGNILHGFQPLWDDVQWWYENEKPLSLGSLEEQIIKLLKYPNKLGSSPTILRNLLHPSHSSMYIRLSFHHLCMHKIIFPFNMEYSLSCLLLERLDVTAAGAPQSDFHFHHRLSEAKFGGAHFFLLRWVHVSGSSLCATYIETYLTFFSFLHTMLEYKMAVCYPIPCPCNQHLPDKPFTEAVWHFQSSGMTRLVAIF